MGRTVADSPDDDAVAALEVTDDALQAVDENGLVLCIIRRRDIEEEQDVAAIFRAVALPVDRLRLDRPAEGGSEKEDEQERKIRRRSAASPMDHLNGRRLAVFVTSLGGKREPASDDATSVA